MRVLPLVSCLVFSSLAAMEVRALATDPAPASTAAESVSEDSDSYAQQLKSQMLGALDQGTTLWALLFAFLAGLLTSLMGCVYPLIPVAMAVIGTRETQSRLGSFGLSLVYVLGMCLLYTTLGLIFAALGKAFGSWMGSPWVVGGIVLFFVVMALSIAGVFEFRLPGSLERKLNQMGGKGITGAFLAGLVSGLVMAPCTGPVLSVILVFIAKTQSFFFGFWLLFFLSLGTGFLFLLIGTFSGLVTRLPKSGSWMEIVRALFAMLMMGMAFFFLRGTWSGLHNAVVAIAGPGWLGLIGLAAAAAIGGFHLSFPEGSSSQRARKALGLLLGATGVFLLATFVFVGSSNVQWHKDLDASLALGRQNQQPVMLDFWATWCTACVDLDRKTFSDPAVGQALARFIPVKVDCTNSVDDEALGKLMEKYGAMDLPTIRFVDSQGKLLAKPVVKGFVNARQMKQLLESIP